MDIQHIPKTFWHSLSIAVLVVSSGLTYIAYRSSTVSIELANTKINLSSELASSTIALSSALDEAKDAKADTEKKYDELLRQYERLEERLKQLKATTDVEGSVKSLFDKLRENCPDCMNLQPLPKSLPLTSFDQNINKAQLSLERLETLNKQIQSMQ